MVKTALSLALIGSGLLAVSYSVAINLILLIEFTDTSSNVFIQFMVTDIFLPGGVGAMLMRLGLTLLRHQRHIAQHSVTVEVD